MTKLQLKAVDQDGKALALATFDITFRGVTLFGIEWDTGKVSVKADENGEATVNIPLLSNKAHIITTSGANISDTEVKVSLIDDWMYWINPTSAALADVLTTSTSIDITQKVAGGPTQLVQYTEFDPIKVASYRASSVWKRTADWIVGNVVTIVVLLAAAGITIYLVKYIAKPVTNLAKKGKDIVKEIKGKVMY